MRRVIVTGAGGPAGGSLVQQLRLRGHAVLGLDSVSRGSADFAIDPIPAALEPVFASQLFSTAQRWGADLIIPTVTEELIVPQLHEPQRNWAIAIAPLAAVQIANDKWLTVQALQAQGIAVPHSALAGGDEVSPTWLAMPDDVSLLSKPRLGRGARGVRVHENGQGARDSGQDRIVQELVTGTEYVVDLFVDPNTRDIRATVAMRKTKLAQGIVGNGISVERLSPDTALDVVDLACRAVRAIGLTGPADIDVRRRADGQAVVLEINARFGAHSAHAPEVLDGVLDAYALAVH